MLLSEMLHGPKLDPAAAVTVPDRTALYASSVPDGKCSFFSARYATSLPPCQKLTLPGVTVTSSFWVLSRTSLSFATVVAMFPTPTP